MMSENTKEFRIKEYVHIFEKSLNYMAGVILSIFISGIIYLGSETNGNITINEILKNIHDDPKPLFCVLVAVLSTLPYYFYYSLKDDTAWNACNGRRDNWGLAKICILYEICIMSLLYLLLQGNVCFAGSKFLISIINIILILIYMIFLFKGKRDGERIGYFFSIIVLVILLFLWLSVNRWRDLMENFDKQNFNIFFLVLFFFVNAGVNTFFLARADSCEETGIISNRIKIMIPIISISIYTTSVICCFFYFSKAEVVTLFIALWITIYEIAISCIKFQKNTIKIVVCVISFVIFVFGIPVMPMFIKGNKALLSELGLNWLILVGISIYLAAIKYWGYILKFLFGEKERKNPKEKIMNILIWFRNSILGSMLFISVVLISSKRYYILLIIIIVCSLGAECFISHYIFRNPMKSTDKAYFKGRIIEFLAIILPVGIFSLENYSKFKLETHLDFKKDLPQYIEIMIAILSILLICLHIQKKWTEKKQEELSNFEWKKVMVELFRYFKNFQLLEKQILSDKTRRSFRTIVISWCVYVMLSFVSMGCILTDSEFRIFALLLIVVIIITDWFVLSRELVDYYILKAKKGKKIMKFLDIFNEKWKECLKTLSDFKESDAEQFMIGDRLRPILFFMGSSYKCFENLSDDDYNNIAKAACSLELIHKSSVMFDDYIDGDTKRKGAATFHVQYSDINKLILLGNAMLSKAQTNFVECREYFKCNDSDTIENIKKLSEIIFDLCKGCYKELSRGDYNKQSKDEIKKIIQWETVSLIKGSIGLGYSCFHADQGEMEYDEIEKLGKAFGYVFQYLNDLEPFSQKTLYEKHKGKKSHFDYGKKNIALVTLYDKASDEDKKIFEQRDYSKIIQLYKKYDVEQEILREVKKQKDEIENLLGNLNAGNREWTSDFKILFNKALAKKGWEEVIPLLE